MISLRTIASFLGFKSEFPMKLLEQGTQTALPCAILEYAENQSWEIPSEPIETSEFIGDTQFRQPKILNLSVFVLDEAVSEFERRIKDIQANKNGFEFVDRNGFKFVNFWITDYNKTGDANNGYIYALSLQEVILVEAFNNAVSYQQTSNSGLSGKTNNGEQSSNAKKTTTEQNGKRKVSVLGTITGVVG